MRVIKGTSKVTPIEVAPKHNNLFKKRRKIVEQLKIVMWAQIVVGVNRLYLLQKGKIGMWISYVYCVILMSITIIFMINSKSKSASYLVILDTTCIEYIIIVCNSMMFKRQTFRNFFDNLRKFDEILNINKNLDITSPIYRGVIWMIASLTYSVTECILLLVYVYDDADYTFVITYLTMTAHDSEHVLFCSLLRMILQRIRIIKAHIAKTFDEQKPKDKLSSIEALANNAQLDIGSLHRIYELLHKCAEQLNSIMGFPLIVSFFCSGLSTTMLLKSLFKELQEIDTLPITRKAMIVYSSVRCFKYTMFVVIPCYYSSITTTQVSNIRTKLHDAMNGDQLEKMNRRLVKAFFQLTRENEFAYALWGVIRLNMSLPLSYSSLCTTYLVIIIQFSKFID